MRWLVEKDGRRQNVESLEAYADWAVIASDVPAVPLQVRKAETWDRVKTIREAVENSACATSFGPVQTDDRSKVKINGLVAMAQIAAAAGEPFAEPFTMADNSVVVLDAADVLAMGVAVGQFISAVYARGRVLREAIDAAESDAELDAIDIEAGWPS